MPMVLSSRRLLLTTGKGVPTPPAGTVLWTETVGGAVFAYYEVTGGVRYYLTRVA